jgi:hypothetical protein
MEMLKLISNLTGQSVEMELMCGKKWRNVSQKKTSKLQNLRIECVSFFPVTEIYDK